MASLAVREKPPLRNTVIATTPAGQRFRWGEDSRRAADQPDQVSHGSTAPGGYSDFSASLPRVYQNDYPDLPPLTELRVLDGAGSTVWEGYLERAPRRSGDEITVGPEAVGFQNLLADETNLNWLGVDADLNNWAGATALRKVWQNAFNIRVVDGQVDTDEYDGTPSFTIELTSPWAAAPSGEGSYTPPPGTYVAKIAYDYGSRSSEASSPAATYALYLSVCDDLGTLTNNAPSSDLYAAAGGSGSGTFTPPAPRAYAYVRWAPPAGALATDGATYAVYFTRLTPIGDHGLTLYTTDAGGPGLLASDVIKHLVGKVNGISVLGRNVATTGLAIPHSRGDGTNLPDLIAEHNKYHLWDWAVWEGKQFYYDSPGEAEVHRTWKARVGPSQLEETGKDARRIRNGVYVAFTDSQGVRRVVGPPGTRADYTSDSLVVTDPENEANQAGRAMYDLVEMRGVSEQEPAVAVGEAYLALLGQADRSGTAAVAGYVQADSGAWFPHTSVRAGDQIQFTDASDPTPRRIVEVSHDHAGRTSSVTLDAPSNTIEAILDRLSLSLTGTGLS